MEREPPEYIDIRIDGKLLFKYAPEQNIIQIQRRGIQWEIDLDAKRNLYRDQKKYGLEITSQ